MNNAHKKFFARHREMQRLESGPVTYEEAKYIAKARTCKFPYSMAFLLPPSPLHKAFEIKSTPYLPGPLCLELVKKNQKSGGL